MGLNPFLGSYSTIRVNTRSKNQGGKELMLEVYFRDNDINYMVNFLLMKLCMIKERFNTVLIVGSLMWDSSGFVERVPSVTWLWQ